MQQQQSQNQAIVPASTPPSITEEAPPKQVAQAMERLNHAARLIADIRLGADRILEALFVAAEPHQSKPIELFVKEDSSMRKYLRDLRSIGKQLEESAVLNESLRLRSNSWGLHMPLVCPDGAVVAYAWKRQLAGQAGASAVDRTRLALKAFTDQKRHFFPHLDDELMEPASKKHCIAQALSESNEDEPTIFETLPDVLNSLAKEVPALKILTHERLDWLKRAISLPASANDNSMEGPNHNFPGSSLLRPAPQGLVASDKVTIIELFFPSIFRAIISLHPAGSIEPDAVAFFSPDEGGSYMHARGSSVYHIFRYITEHAALALQYFIGIGNETALYTLLHWICTYQTLFTKSCSKCRRLLAIDRQSAVLLPPVHRPYRNFSASKSLSTGDLNANTHAACHIGCYADQEA